MQTRCERSGQIEIGIIEHEGRTFSAYGATVVGRNLTAYTSHQLGKLTLTTWCGKTILDCRSEIVERYFAGAMAIMFRLTHGRFIVGYVLADDGMLFRGELLTNIDEDDARKAARQLASRCAELDADDENCAEEEQ